MHSNSLGLSERLQRSDLDLAENDLGSLMGSSTGGAEYTTVTGGWAGTDDATSTAPSDQIGIPSAEDEKPVAMIARDIDETIWMDDAEQIDHLEEVDEVMEQSDRRDRGRQVQQSLRIKNTLKK
ncbi:MAG: hypothetical protein HYZ71_14455 [Deltaproteobacteria bacterium]|nr:hypothetical protein [Deltaproteobacteria bacterium]